MKSVTSYTFPHCTSKFYVYSRNGILYFVTVFIKTILILPHNSVVDLYAVIKCVGYYVFISRGVSVTYSIFDKYCLMLVDFLSVCHLKQIKCHTFDLKYIYFTLEYVFLCL